MDVQQVMKRHETAVRQDMYTVKELREVARDLELPGRSTMNKAQLRALITNVFDVNAPVTPVEATPVTPAPVEALSRDHVSAEADRTARRAAGYRKQNGTEGVWRAYLAGRITAEECRGQAYTPKQLQRMAEVGARFLARHGLAA